MPDIELHLNCLEKYAHTPKEERVMVRAVMALASIVQSIHDADADAEEAERLAMDAKERIEPFAAQLSDLSEIALALIGAEATDVAPAISPLGAIGDHSPSMIHLDKLLLDAGADYRRKRAFFDRVLGGVKGWNEPS